MERRTLLRGARQLLTLRGPKGPRSGSAMSTLNVIDDGAVLIEDGVIREVGPSRRVENLAAARDAEELSADGRLVMPGFVDCRTHLVSGPPLLAEYEARNAGATQPEIDAGGGGRNALRRAIHSSTRPRLEMLARDLLRQFIRHGTSTLEAHSGLGADDKSELKILRALDGAGDRALDLLVTCYAAAGVPPGFAGSPGQYLEHLASYLLPKIKRLKLAHFVDILVGAGGFTAEQARDYVKQAEKLKLAARVTAAGDPGEAIALAVELGLPSVAGIDQVAASDAARLAGSETVAVLLPGEAFHLRKRRYPAARRLIKAGAAVAIASGYSSDGSPTCSMPAILSLACGGMGLSSAEAITGATINAAHAIWCGHRIGSIECGKQADLIMLNVSDYREIPYHFGMNLVSMMMKRGDVIYPRMEYSWANK